MTILFITRNFPPVRGGMETEAFWLHHYLSRQEKVILLNCSLPRPLLLFCFPYLLFKSCFLLLSTAVDAVYLHDGLLSVLAIFFKLFGKKTLITIHGLDITFRNKFFQILVPRCARLADRIICISVAAKEECVKRNIPAEKISVIPEGIEDAFYITEPDRAHLREEFCAKFGFDAGRKKILLSVCRLVERKGVQWFVEEVMPLVRNSADNFLYVVVGEGPMKRRIEDDIKSAGLDECVKLLGALPQDDLKLAYNACDIFVMPNIPVEGDMEGFGIVLLEAASCGLAIVASELEGIRDAVLEGMGVLVPPLSPEKFRAEVLRLSDEETLSKYRRSARNSALTNFEWKKIAEGYLVSFKEITRV